MDWKTVDRDKSGEFQITEANSPKALERVVTTVKFLGVEAVETNKDLNVPIEVLSHVAHIHSKFHWFDVVWLVGVTFMTPAALALLWFGAIPLGDAEGDFHQKVVWVFLVNSGTYVVFSFMLVNIFLACLDEKRPWRPFKYYAHVLVLNYVLQVGVIGTIVLVHGTFPALGFVAIAISLTSTGVGLRFMPHVYFDCDQERYLRKLNSFIKILIFFALFWIVLIGYIIANGNSDSAAQGFLTAALSILTFIFKKIFLGLTDKYPIEVAMVIAGLWLENIVDLFISLAYPTATSVGLTYLVIWLTRVAENIAYLGFQFEAWFKFRVWIKGKFKKEQTEIVKEDINPDDRGHSNQHPGYRRRQMRFLAWKLLSQLSSGIFFLVTIPALRYGQNHKNYPYSGKNIKFDVHGEHGDNIFSYNTFEKSMAFAAFSMFTSICSGIIIFGWMWYYHPDVVESLTDRYRYLILSHKYFGFVVTVLSSNVLLAVSAVQLFNRLYFY